MTTGRTPKPPDTSKLQLMLHADNHRHVLRVLKELGAPSKTAVINDDLGFVATFGIPTVRARVLVKDAARQKLETRDYIQEVVFEAVAALPSGGAPHPSEIQTPQVPMAINLSGGNVEYLKARMGRTGQSFVSVLNDELRFAWRFNLDPKGLGRLEHAAKQRDLSVREFVLELLIQRSIRVEAAVKAERPTSSRGEEPVTVKVPL